MPSESWLPETAITLSPSWAIRSARARASASLPSWPKSPTSSTGRFSANRASAGRTRPLLWRSEPNSTLVLSSSPGRGVSERYAPKLVSAPSKLDS